jgi:hypothetical protein
MRAIKPLLALCVLATASYSFADAKCEAHAKTRDDYLTCDKSDIDKTLGDADKLYRNIKKNLVFDKLYDFEKNNQMWKDRIKSDCKIVGYAFNDWTNDYTPDTDFQISACRSKIARQELELYKRLSCPDEMETTADSKCETIKNVLRPATH